MRGSNFGPETASFTFSFFTWGYSFSLYKIFIIEKQGLFFRFYAGLSKLPRTLNIRKDRPLSHGTPVLWDFRDFHMLVATNLTRLYCTRMYTLPDCQLYQLVNLTLAYHVKLFARRLLSVASTASRTGFLGAQKSPTEAGLGFSNLPRPCRPAGARKRQAGSYNPP
jgi:hypothetical protein